MRLSDTIFLTLTICLLQVYIGMRCLYEVRSQKFTVQQTLQPNGSMSLALEKVQCDQVQANSLWHVNGTLC